MSSSQPGPPRPIGAQPLPRDVDWHALVTLVHADPGGRGLAGFRRHGRALDDGQWLAAAQELAGSAKRVAIATGFCVVLPEGVTAETDGPPGALFLAQTLAELGVEVTLVTDRVGLPLLECGLRLLGWDRSRLVEFPGPVVDDEASTVDRWVDAFLSASQGPTHLIAIERPGPSHTADTLAAQAGGTETLERFEREVPRATHGACHTMRGVSIDAHTAPVHRLFEAAGRRTPRVTTIGIGDGGNEIGMGRFAWEDLAAAIPGGAGGQIACRTPTDFTLVAGTSNWGGYALALATAALGGRLPTSRWLRPEGQGELVERLVNEAGAVDGCTGQSTGTVDGLSLEAFLQPLAELWTLFDR